MAVHEVRYVLVDDERNEPTEDEIRTTEGLALALMYEGSVGFITPAWMGTLQVIVRMKDNQYRLTRTPSELPLTKLRHFDRLVEKGVLEMHRCADTGKQVLSQSERLKGLVTKVRRSFHA